MRRTTRFESPGRSKSTDRPQSPGTGARATGCAFQPVLVVASILKENLATSRGKKKRRATRLWRPALVVVGAPAAPLARFRSGGADAISAARRRPSPPPKSCVGDRRRTKSRSPPAVNASTATGFFTRRATPPPGSSATALPTPMR